MSEKTKPDLSGLLSSGAAFRRKTTPIDKPSGRFIEIGGIEICPAQEFEKPDTPIDLSEVGGKVVRKAR